MTDRTGARPAGREALLVQTFVRLADTLVDDYDVADLLHELVACSVELLDAAEGGILLDDQRGGLHLVASSSEQTRMLELFQLQTAEGPCLECFRTGDAVEVEDLTEMTHRWPQFAPRAASIGFRAVAGMPLRLRRQTIGAMNLFRAQPGRLRAADRLVIRAFADTATIGILQERAVRRSETLTEQLQTALHTRIAIEQAKGVIAQAAGLPMGDAFDLLRSYARTRGARLGRIANDVVAGTLLDEVLAARRSSHAERRDPPA